jgi:soluble lytic murein transglycosylase-like protein
MRMNLDGHIKITFLKSEVNLFVTTMLVFSFVAHHKDPYSLYKAHKEKYAQEIIKKSIQNKVNPSEMLAIAVTESALNPKAYSHTKDVGLFQVNCKWWYKKFNYNSIKSCERAMMNASVNIDAGIYILKYFRKNFKQCAGKFAYRCYNGGQRWQRSKNKDKIIRYATSVLKRKKKIDFHYYDYIDKYKREALFNELLY